MAHADAWNVPLPRDHARADRVRVRHRTLARNPDPTLMDLRAEARCVGLCNICVFSPPPRDLSVFALAPAAALAAPPPTTTTRLDPGRRAAENVLQADTTEASTQPDLFNPNRDGQPLGGGDPEPPRARATARQDRLVRLAPKTNYGVRCAPAASRPSSPSTSGTRPTPTSSGRSTASRGQDLLIDSTRTRTTRSRSPASRRGRPALAEDGVLPGQGQ